MKIGIVSFQNAINYGATLQIYALQTQLEKLGHEVNIINYFSEAIENSNRLKRTPKIYRGAKFRTLKMIYSRIKIIYTKKQWEKKYYLFQAFMDNRLHKTVPIYNNENLNEYVSRNNIEVLICGSDQIWNPNITGGLDDIYFLNIKQDIKKISYAASCGSINVLKGRESEFFLLINNLDGVSVREQELSDYITSNSKIENKVVLDPTLLLKKEEYNLLVKESINEKYVLIYLKQENSELIKIAKIIAKKHALKIKLICDNKFFKFSNDIEYLTAISPEDFLGYFKEAQFIATNSFHGTAFSIIYEKQFITVPHKSVGSRMIGLLETLDLKNNIIYKSKELKEGNYSEIDYKKIKPKLNSLIDSSQEFLHKINSEVKDEIK